MKAQWFQIRSSSECILSRDEEDWAREFPCIEKATEFAAALPEAPGSELVIVDEYGSLLVRTFL